MAVLSSTLAKNFTSNSRSRGQVLSQYGQVRILSGSAWEVDARVQGTKLYQVQIRLVNNEVHVCCTCPFYASSGPCKHLWATILQAQSRGFLQGDVALSHLILIEDIPPETTPEATTEADPNAPHVFPPRGIAAKARLRVAPPAPPPDWRRQFEDLQPRPQTDKVVDWPSDRRLLYLIDPPASRARDALVVEITVQDRKVNGEWGKPKTQRLLLEQLKHLPDDEDREIISTLSGSRRSYETAWVEIDAAQHLFSPLSEMLVPRLCATGRCGIRLGDDNEWAPLSWDDSEPWRPAFRLRPDKERWIFEAFLRRGEQTLAIEDVHLITPGLVFTALTAARLDAGEAFPWLQKLRRKTNLFVPTRDGPEFLERLLGAPHLPPPEVPAELAYEEVRLKPQPRIHIAPLKVHTSQKLVAEVSFLYEDLAIERQDQRLGIYDPNRRRLLRRDLEAERAAVARIEEFHLRPHRSYWSTDASGWEVPAKRLPSVVGELSSQGWRVEAEGKLFRQPSDLRLAVSSGIDWFELHGEADFGDLHATLPELLKALRRGDHAVLLGDGSYGVLPEEWLARLQLLADIGESAGDHYRFKSNQAMLLDVLLAEQPQVNVDETFERARRQLREFSGIRSSEQPATMQGTLRNYQREGLGWMQFLQSFGFGGCLADDMGVGKTVQVLALLETRRLGIDATPRFQPPAVAQLSEAISSEASNGITPSEGAKTESAAVSENGAGSSNGNPGFKHLPSLVVVPRSLIFNWMEESTRFTPLIRVKDHTGIARESTDFENYDLILTTYGTLQRDAAILKDVEFDYVILDEAQAIKNAQTKSAKAVRLLRARHRLALSGTPVENHLGELWSLFEFLNPGMLSASWLGKNGVQSLRNPSDSMRQMLARVLRPFILRRTKEQVVAELPPKLEQTLFCEMQTAQRKLYDQLRAHYRQTLLGIVDQQGLSRSKIHVLEALLRLRQAACHPGLIDPKKVPESSAKLETLMPLLSEVLDEGHKALVFSQFTSLLAIVKQHLDTEGVTYEYLDGQTRDRKACVDRFQTDPDCKLFLISLKAGGLGLNLTAAQYVFLLDPWWNPAVEAQAIDRAHRIGQNHPVFAYRLIAKDTVEEKILELQRHKRDLADAIITADNSVISSLSREDLEMLLS